MLCDYGAADALTIWATVPWLCTISVDNFVEKYLWQCLFSMFGAVCDGLMTI